MRGKNTIQLSRQLDLHQGNTVSRPASILASLSSTSTSPEVHEATSPSTVYSRGSPLPRPAPARDRRPAARLCRCGFAFEQRDHGVRIRSYSGFFMDDWKVTHEADADLGLRYDLVTPPVEVVDRQLAFDLQRGSWFRKARLLSRPGIHRSGHRTTLLLVLVCLPRQLPPRLCGAGYGIFWAFEDNGTSTLHSTILIVYRQLSQRSGESSSAVRLDTGFPANALTSSFPSLPATGLATSTCAPPTFSSGTSPLERQVHSDPVSRLLRRQQGHQSSRGFCR